MAKNLTYDVTHKKLKPKWKKKFIADSKTCRVFWGFEQLSSTIDWQVMELQSGAKLVVQCIIFRYDTFVHW